MFLNKHFQYYQTKGPDYLIFSTPTEQKTINRWTCQYFQVTDSTMKDEDRHDYHVTMTLGLTPQNDLFVVDVFREHIPGDETLRAIKQQRIKHSRENGKTYILRNFIEDKQSGTIAIQQARKLEDGFLLTELKRQNSNLKSTLQKTEQDLVRVNDDYLNKMKSIWQNIISTREVKPEIKAKFNSYMNNNQLRAIGEIGVAGPIGLNKFNELSTKNVKVYTCSIVQ